MNSFFTLYRKLIRIFSLASLLLCTLYYIISFYAAGGLSGALYRLSTGEAQEPGAFSAYFHAKDPPLPDEEVKEEEPPLVLEHQKALKCRKNQKNHKILLKFKGISFIMKGV